jgi:hypothetical protein
MQTTGRERRNYRPVHTGLRSSEIRHNRLADALEVTEAKLHDRIYSGSLHNQNNYMTRGQDAKTSEN